MKLKFLITLLIISKITSKENLPEWEDTTKTLFNPTNLEADSLTSFSLDNITDSVLYLGKKSSSSLFFLNGEKTIENTLKSEISYINSPLVTYNGYLYFCSDSPYLTKLKISDNSLERIPFPESINAQDATWKLKCLYQESTHSILVGMIDFSYILSYKLDEEKWADKLSSKLYVGTLMAMNIYDPSDNCPLGIVHKTQDKYYLKILQYTNDEYYQIHNFCLSDLDKEEYLQFYSKTELSFQNWDVVIIFTYEPGKKDFKYYHLERGKQQLILYGGKNVLPFFNEYQINDAQFIENSALLAYSLKSLKSERYYIGVTDLYYGIILNNIETLRQNRIFVSQGYLRQGKAFINYFYDYQQKKICPFVYKKDNKNNDTCKYYDTEHKYFSIQLNEESNLYENSFTDECKDGKVFGNYCLLNCPLGYTDEEGQCKICDSSNYFNYGTKTCSSRCDYQKDAKICYDCEKDGKIFYENDCISSCNEVYGEEDPSDKKKCLICKDQNKFYDTFNKQCVSQCPEKSERSDYTGECKECSKYNQLYYKYENKCVDECPFYYISDNGECKLCESGKLYMNGKCVSACSDGYAEIQTQVEGKTIKYCQYCKDIDKYFYDEECYWECPIRHQAYDENNICYFCGEAGRDKSKKYNQDNTCVEECSEGYQTFDEDPHFYCRSCIKENLFFAHDKKCQPKCEEYATFYKENNVCYFCNETDDGDYLEKDKCVSECSPGFVLNKTFKYCDFCHDHGLFYYKGKCQEKCDEYLGWEPDDNICTNCSEEKGYYYENNRCVQECDVTARKDTSKGICVHCPEAQKYYIEGKCAENCPDFTLLNETNNLCYYCASDFSYLEYQCVTSCGDPYISKEIGGHKVCALCDKDTWYQGGRCVDTCEEGHSYALEEDGSCHFCYCGEKGECEKFSSKCKCEDEDHYFGHSCEFYSYQKIGEKKVQIFALDDSCIKSKTTLFGYKINDKENFTKNVGDEFYVKWGFYLGKEEITKNENYEKYFTTGYNEDIFGINAYLLSDSKKNNVTLSIYNKDDKLVYSDVITISVQTINTLPIYQLDYQDKENYKPMEKVCTIEQLKFDNHLQYKYDYQFAFIDSFNEELPLTSFISNKSLKTLVPYCKMFVMHLKNDRGEIISSSIENTKTKTHENTMTINEIINYEKITNTEKIFKLMTYFYGNNSTFTEEDFYLIFNSFLLERYKEIINENGYYKEPTEIISRDRKLIVYSEPKILFSLINRILYNQKSQIEQEKIEIILNSIKTCFDISFNITENNEDIEINNYKVFSSSDLLSLLRTLDQALEIAPSIGTKRSDIGSDLFYEILTDFSQYLSYKIYPGEAIKMKGKRIAMLSYNFGKYQKLLSLPSPDFSKETDINDFSTYDLEDYGPNEESCDINSGKLLCIDNEYFSKLKNKLAEKKIDISKIKLNLIMVKTFEKINKYTINFNLYDSEHDTYIINLKDFDILFNIEFPLDSPYKKEEQNKDKLDPIKNYINLKENNSNIVANYSNITCVPKNYIKNSKYYCYTHFNYEANTIRCTCNVLDEITFVEDYDLANYYKSLQFSTIEYKYINYVSSGILYIVAFLLFVPGIIYALSDIHKDNALLKLKKKPQPQEYKRQKYLEIKRFTNTGVFGFSFQLLFCKFPFFWACDIYNYFYPKYIRHFVVINGIFLGFVLALLPFIFYLPFIERQTFIDQRDTNVEDKKIHSIDLIDSYMIRANVFAFIATIITDLFIFFFGKFLSYEQIETNHWKKIRNALREYLYGKIKKKSLFGPNWKKLKMRMKAIYALCGNYILRKNLIRHPNRNPVFEDYLRSAKGNKKSSKVLEADFLKKNKPGKETSNKEDLLCELTEGNNINNSIDEINTDLKKRGNYIPPRMIGSGKVISIKDGGKYKVISQDSFILDGQSKNISTNREFSKIEKARYKYLVGPKIREEKTKKEDKNKKRTQSNINNINISNKNPRLVVYHSLNFSFHSVENYSLVKGSNEASSDLIEDKFSRYSLITFILWVILFVLFILSLVIVKNLLDGYEYFIIKTWLIPAVLFIIVGNFVFYYIKLLIGSILLFGFYHSRKRRMCVKLMFKLFVDKSMIYIYKTRNYITKYRRDYINI